MVENRVEISALAEDLRVTDRIAWLNLGMIVSHRLHGAGPETVSTGFAHTPRRDHYQPTERFVVRWLRPRATGK